ncbi:MAG: hypothetical protein NPIRA06_21570 [Nitrospirales bacterium]|nr:MAG: hypothetical protein NPIRA06_21570 [Nitrospirales bacterium]
MALIIKIFIEHFYLLGKVCLVDYMGSIASSHSLFYTHMFFEGIFNIKKVDVEIFQNGSMAHLLLIYGI